MDQTEETNHEDEPEICWACDGATDEEFHTCPEGTFDSDTTIREKD